MARKSSSACSDAVAPSTGVMSIRELACCSNAGTVVTARPSSVAIRLILPMRVAGAAVAAGKGAAATTTSA
eukprot:2494485-Prymnesium_polylepis.1